MNLEVNFKEIEFEKSLNDEFKNNSHRNHAAHCLFWFSLTDQQKQEIKKQINCDKEFANSFGLMQLRSDGLLGFPGGFVSRPSIISFNLKLI